MRGPLQPGHKTDHPRLLSVCGQEKVEGSRYLTPTSPSLYCRSVVGLERPGGGVRSDLGKSGRRSTLLRRLVTEW